MELAVGRAVNTSTPKNKKGMHPGGCKRNGYLPRTILAISLPTSEVLEVPSIS